MAFLTLASLSAFSFLTYKKTRAICSATHPVTKDYDPAANGIMPWDAVSRQFTSISLH